MRRLFSVLSLSLVACGASKFEKDTDWCPNDFAVAAHEGFADEVCTYVRETCPGIEPELAEACTNNGEAGVVDYFAHLGDCVVPCTVRSCYFNLKRAIAAGQCDTNAFYDPPDVCNMLYQRFDDDQGQLTCGDFGGVYWEAP